MNRILSWFHSHKPAVVGVQHFEMSVDSGSIPTTVALFRCPCGMVYTDRYPGKWTVDNINGSPTVAPVVSIAPQGEIAS